MLKQLRPIASTCLLSRQLFMVRVQARQLCSPRLRNSQQSESDEATAKRRRLFVLASGVGTLTLVGTFYIWKEAKLKELEANAQHGRVGPEASVGSSSTSAGNLAVGGDFKLLDQTGKYVTLQDLTGDSNWLLMYFGFCHCPDVCPEQMEKMAEIVERLRLAKEPHAVTPVFVSIDPERDTPALVKEYIADFGGRFIGLTGLKAEVEAVVKKYRVYYSKGPVDHDGDYIVDHAIIMYLVSPRGSVVDYYGQTKTSKDIAACIGKVIKGYKA